MKARIKFNDLFAVLMFAVLIVLWCILPRTGLGQEQIGLIVGAAIVWIGQIVTYYWRKKPEEETPPTSLPPRG